MMEEKKSEFIILAINKMFIFANSKTRYKDIKNSKTDWFAQETMTTTQLEEWKIWFIANCIKTFNVTSRYANNTWSHFNLNWGLKIKD